MHVDIFKSSNQYQQYYIQHLASLLDSDELGVFILVLANAVMDAEIFYPLKPRIEHRIDYFSNQLNQATAYPPDDVCVFKQLQQLGLDQVRQTLNKKIGPWDLQFNPIRSLRPARNSDKKITYLKQAFDREGFHFNKSFLVREIIWKGVFISLDLSLFYNKFPFADYHAIVLIDAQSEKPQHLSQQDCENISSLIDGLAALSGIGLAYNSLGAYASVNHQHWQMMLTQQPYPIEHECWRHNGGLQDYPVEVLCFDSPQHAWHDIDTLQQNHHAFNLLLRADKTYLIKRKKQGEYQHQPWAAGFAWSEVCGNFTLTQLSDYQSLTAAAIEQELRLLKTD